MTTKQLADALGLTVFALPRPEAELRGGYAGDLLSWVMGRARPGDAWLTIMSNQNVAAVSLLCELACVILAEEVTPDPALLARAEEQGLNLLGSSMSTFSLSRAVGALVDRTSGAGP